MKSVLISINPKWCALIASGEKTVEARKTTPKLETPFKVYIYCTKGRGDCLWRWEGIWYDTQDPNHRPNRLDGKVIGEFVCDSLIWVLAHPSIFAAHPLFYSQAINDACLTRDEVEKYSGGKDVYGWHISDLVIYDKPRELSEFNHACPDNVRSCMDCKFSKDGWHCPPITRPPQSWCYVEDTE